MRIVGGRLSGRRLAALGAGVPDAALRPTADRVREALFNALAHGDYPTLEGARVLDLFAGTGALGLEALSRGARFAVFVEENAKARALIRNNVEMLGLTGAAKIFRRDATRPGPNRSAPFDVVFADPPYGRGLGDTALHRAHENGWMADGALVVLEEAADVAPSLDAAVFTAVGARRYGDTQIHLFRHRSGPASSAPG